MRKHLSYYGIPPTQRVPVASVRSRINFPSNLFDASYQKTEAMHRCIVAVLLVISAFPALAQRPVAQDFRCLSSGTGGIQLEFRMFSDPDSHWTGGYVKYRKSALAIPLVLKSSDGVEMAEGRPWEYTDVWLEVSGGKISGEYEVIRQGANIYGFTYQNRKTAKRIDFIQDNGAMGEEGCVWPQVR